MIPAFNSNGYLQAGVHRASISEIAERFGSSTELRRVQMESVKWMIDLAIRAGVQRIVLNGSFVTDIIEPNDVDCVLLIGKDYPKEAKAAEELAQGLPFIELAILRRRAFDKLVEDFFAMDRSKQPKGVIEVIYETSK